VHIVFDDVIIAADDDVEHDTALREVFNRARRFNVRFNKDKLRIKLPSVRYLGHVLSADGVKPDPDKICAINDMPTSTDKKSLQRFIGMVQFLGRWLPHLADMKRPLCQLMRDDVEWTWTTQQENAIRDIKAAMISAPALRFFDPSKPAVLQCDASSLGLGAVLLQEDQPCAFASRALTDETRYAQIEKELLAIVFAAEKFEHYIYGKRTVIHSDHRPLQTIFQKPTSKTTPRLQRMLIRIARFDLDIVYRPGKHMHVADALSRAYLPFEPTNRDVEMADDIDVTVHSLIYELPASNSRLEEIRRQTATCPVLSRLRTFLRDGFPDKSPSWELAAYRHVSTNIIDADGLLLMDNKIIIPVDMRQAMLALIHERHLGVEKSKALARQTLCWPGMSGMIEGTVTSCAACCANRHQQSAEPLLPHPVPFFPWEKISADIFTFNKRDYLLVVDYFSKFPYVVLLTDKSASSVISVLKSLFAIYGAPLTLIADNMPFSSQLMYEFARN
jgi:hypothetical protein